MIINLVRAEWLKLTRRPLIWVLLGVFLALLVLQILAQFVFAQLASSISVSGNPAAVDAQLEEWRRRTVFPGLFGVAFGHVNGLGGIFAVILTAGAMGSEYSWGTLRTHLARHPGRTRYLIAKLLTLLLLLVVAVMLVLAVTSLLGAVLGAFVGGVGVLRASDLAALPLATLRALYVLLPYVLLTLCFTILGRSLLMGVAGGLLYLVFEAGFGTLAVLQMLGGVWQTLYNLTIQQNINTLVLLNSHAFGLRPETLAPQDLQSPAPLQATLVIALYCLAFFATALYTFRRRDIAGAV